MNQSYKKQLLTCVFLFGFHFFIHAQNDIRELARQWVLAAADELQLSPDDRIHFTVSDAYTDAGTKITYVYIQQRYNGVKVYNAINTLAFRDGILLSQTNRFSPKIALYAANPIVSITPQQAVTLAALAVQAGVPTNLSVVTDDLVQNHTIIFNTGGISRSQIRVEQFWVRREGSDVLDLAWNVNIDKAGSSDWWNVRIHTIEGTVLGKDNWTVSCNWEKPHDHLRHCVETMRANIPVPQLIKPAAPPPPTVTSAGYRVLPYPVESPSHGSIAIENNPWLKPGVGSTAATHGWHFDGTTNYDISRGNNVFAALDTTNANVPQGSDTSSTPIPGLTFTFTPDFTQSPKTKENRRFALSNLFYWNNIIHDLTYKYGFTEPAGNFQADNMSRGGAGNDFVRADAQDGGGTNNANFSTPPDGASGRMQMYLFTGMTPNRDGDLDNGIIVHEYGHGISNRLTGGPSQSSCLINAEQGGEGWSDYFALMLTTNWATATMADSVKPRPMGTYAIGQAPTGAGIRRNPYSYNKTVNPITYASMLSSGQVHNIGEIWCSALWDMTWELCKQQGSISPNLFDTSATGGNVIAMRLVMEGLKLQPCLPGFLDARNAILKADSILYGYAHRCTIDKAFARRGMGYKATQGSNGSTSDQVANFEELPPVKITKTVNLSAVPQNSNVVFTLKTDCICGAPVSNYSIRDSLPDGLQYVSSSAGGVVTGGNVVTFSGINFPLNGQSITHTITAKMIVPGCNPDSLIKDNRESFTIGGLASSSPSATPQWEVSAVRSKSPANAWFVKDTSVVRDTYLTSNQFLLGSRSELSFWHYHALESTYDGGVVEISTTNGASWVDLASRFTEYPYNGTISTQYSSPIGGRRAFTGNISGGAFRQSRIDLSDFANQNVRIRFRMATDNSTGAEGWYIDDVFLQNIGCGAINKVYLRNNLSQRTDSSAVSVISTPVTPVPLTLLSFVADKVDNGVVLQWTTTNEVNTDRFEIWKSTDGVQWQLLGTAAAAGNSNLEKQYRLTDLKPAVGINYYRIKTIDLDGRFTLSPIRTIRFDGRQAILSIRPNPADQWVVVNIGTSIVRAQLQITDYTGRRVWSTNINTAQGASYTIPTQNLPSGIYGLSIEGDNSRQVLKLVVQH
jgi:uncharacterized repeat protein (TIGR01451 family)